MENKEEYLCRGGVTLAAAAVILLNPLNVLLRITLETAFFLVSTPLFPQVSPVASAFSHRGLPISDLMGEGLPPPTNVCQ